MVKINADPTDGPTVDTSDPAGSVMSVLMSLVGMGLFFAVLAAAQNTTAPLFSSAMNAIPGVNAGDDSGTSGIRVG